MSASVNGGRKRLASAKNLPNSTLYIPTSLNSNINNPYINFYVNSPEENIAQDDEYIMKRQRNNAAVNKTRQKKRLEEMSVQSRVQQLRDENELLER